MGWDAGIWCRASLHAYRYMYIIIKHSAIISSGAAVSCMLSNIILSSDYSVICLSAFHTFDKKIAMVLI